MIKNMYDGLGMTEQLEEDAGDDLAVSFRVQHSCNNEASFSMKRVKLQNTSGSFILMLLENLRSKES